MTASQQGELILLNPGQQIFQKGDPGGDLFFIKEGKVEIYTTTKSNDEIHLTYLSEGDVLGILTCLNHAPRMASARAKGDVRCLKVSKNAFEEQLKQMPKWMGIVLKEFTIRLSQMDEKYAAEYQKVAALSGNQLDELFVASQLADAMGEVGKYIVADFDGLEVIYVDDLVASCQKILGYEEKLLLKLLEVFKNNSLVTIEKNPDNRKEFFHLEQAQKLSWFANFVRTSKSGKEKKIVDAKLPFKARQMLIGMFELSQQREVPLEQPIRLKVPELEEVLENTTKKKFYPEHIEACVNASYLRQESKDGVMQLVFTPATLMRTLSSVTTIRSILNIEDDPDDEGPES